MSAIERTNAMTKRLGIRWAAVPLLAVMLTACSDNGMNDLRQFVEQAKEKKGRVEPLPQFKPVETFSYQAAQLRDPFGGAGNLRVAVQGSGGSGVNPDVNRRKEVLENYPLDTLRMMGTFEFKEAKWGLIKAPDGIVYRVRPGSHLGQNYGKVQSVQDKKITLVEIIPDGLGGWLERDAYLAINDQ